MLLKAFQLSARAAAAAGLAIAAAGWLHLEFPLYAMIAAVIVTELSSAETWRLGWPRIVATLVGATTGAIMTSIPTARPLVVGVGIGAAMFAMHAGGFGRAARVAGYTCGIVMMQYHQQPWLYAWYRLYETVLGIVMALLVSQVPMLLQEADERRT